MENWGKSIFLEIFKRFHIYFDKPKEDYNWDYILKYNHIIFHLWASGGRTVKLGLGNTGTVGGAEGSVYNDVTVNGARHLCFSYSFERL